MIKYGLFLTLTRTATYACNLYSKKQWTNIPGHITDGVIQPKPNSFS